MSTAERTPNTSKEDALWGDLYALLCRWPSIQGGLADMPESDQPRLDDLAADIIRKAGAFAAASPASGGEWRTERERCLAIIRSRIILWDAHAKIGHPGDCTESLADECEDIFAAIQRLPAPPGSPSPASGVTEEEIARLRAVAALIEANDATWGEKPPKDAYCCGPCIMPKLRAALIRGHCTGESDV